MSTAALLARPLAPANAREQAAVTALISGPEAPVSGAPVFAPEALGLLLNLALLSPKEPKEPKKR
ncbi:hypothetical protein [Streptomyces thermolilacinus]|uniref:hypothetical protein n=1 Tax=Streptomyces thermolilacinus TaxID=285540 RepID=UPI0033C93FED